MTSIDRSPNAGAEPQTVRLDSAKLGYAGFISSIAPEDVAADGGINSVELERRLLEMGFVEGAAIEVLHLGLFGKDPIAVRLGDTRVALRRREAHAILMSSTAV
jgi:ferrous iron transport protein A